MAVLDAGVSAPGYHIATGRYIFADARAGGGHNPTDFTESGL